MRLLNDKMSNVGVDGKFCSVAGWGLGRSMAVTHVGLKNEVANHFCGFYDRYFIALHGIACYWVVGFAYLLYFIPCTNVIKMTTLVI